MLKQKMRKELVPAGNNSSEAIPGTRVSYFSSLARKYAASGVRYRMPLAVAILTVAFQEYPLWLQSPIKTLLYGRAPLHVLGAGLFLSALLAVSARTSRLAVALFIAVAVIAILPDWGVVANHTYLA